MTLELSIMSLGTLLILSSLVLVLLRYHALVLLAVVFLFSLAAAVSFLMGPEKSSEAWMGFVKFQCILFLGLGALLAFGALPEALRQSWHPMITRYIHVAVLGNISMMLLTPSGSHLRGVTSKLACFLLLGWLLKEISLRAWDTVRFEGKWFLFTSAPLKWIFCHSIYRFGLITLPIFDTSQYLFLEPLSLSIMFLLYRSHGQKYPLCFYFGFADTLAVSILAMSEKMAHFVPAGLSYRIDLVLTEHQLDWLICPLQMVAIMVAAFELFRRRRGLTISNGN